MGDGRLNDAIRLAKEVIKLTGCTIDRAARVVELFAANSTWDGKRPHHIHIEKSHKEFVKMIEQDLERNFY